MVKKILSKKNLIKKSLVKEMLVQQKNLWPPPEKNGVKPFQKDFSSKQLWFKNIFVQENFGSKKFGHERIEKKKR